MLSRERFLQIIAGQRTGFFESLVLYFLALLAVIYRGIIAVRNRHFDRALKKLKNSPAARQPCASRRSTIQTVNAIVISVGNITTGGTGKTPFVIWMANLFREAEIATAIVSRGYRTPAGREQNDEAMELQSRVPQVPHVQSPDRSEAARRAIDQFNAQVILLDDGFQHRRLYRDLDIVLIDATNPFGFRRLLPRGLLREPLKSLRRCQAVVLTRCELMAAAKQQNLLRELSMLAPQAILSAIQTVPMAWMTHSQTQWPLHHLQDQPIMAFCGIGNSANFFATLRRMDLNLVNEAVFPDHHDYRAQDLECIAAQATQRRATALVCTHKDLVKINSDRIGNLPVYALLIQNEFVSGETELRQLVQNTIANEKTCEYSSGR